MSPKRKSKKKVNKNFRKIPKPNNRTQIEEKLTPSFEKTGGKVEKALSEVNRTLKKEIEKMDQENKLGKLNRQNLIKRWQENNLKDCLYNDDGHGNKIPRASDVDQNSFSDLNYILNSYTLGDCYLLADLMGLAQKNPNFIMENLIHIKSDNEVEVGFFGVIRVFERLSQLFDYLSSYWWSGFEYFGKGYLKVKYVKDGSERKYYSVTKSEALGWKTSHMALWPVVIEIAYAKYLQDNLKNKGSFFKNDIAKHMRRFLLEEMNNGKMEKLSSGELDKLVEEKLSSLLRDDVDFRSFYKGSIKGGIAAATLTSLVGVESRKKVVISRFRGADGLTSKPFPEEGYSAQEIKIYNSIKKKLELGKIIVVSFKKSISTMKNSRSADKKLPKVDAKELALSTYDFVRDDLKADIRGVISDFIKEGSLEKRRYEQWLSKNKLTLDELQAASDKILKKFVLETIDFEKKFRISKKSSVVDDHAYVILNTLDYNRYKYIVLKNPWNMESKIDYQRSKKLPKEVKLPEQIDKVKNEFMMELGHFCKKLGEISYNKEDI